ncbi:MAG TPA: GNAT family N-acetyltransferase [Candidatus Binataceae bacterium]|nr:GNAT family N-acetyltransferase [Candidatus Binataceae bacterium]
MALNENQSSALAGLERVECRLARGSDAAELMPLIRAYYRFDGIRFQSAAISAALATLLRRPSLGRVWIMRDRAMAVGYVVLTFNYDLEFGGLEGIVTDLYIRAEYRGHGLGRRALDLVRTHCRSLGIQALELQVERHNRDARQFYRRLGFRELSRIVMTRPV